MDESYTFQGYKVCKASNCFGGFKLYETTFKYLNIYSYCVCFSTCLSLSNWAFAYCHKK